MPAISTGQRIVYTHPKSTVYVADALREQDFVEEPFLYCELLRTTAGPSIDQAVLVYDYGTVLREGETAAAYYPPLDLVGKFVKVEIVDTVLDESDEPANSITWYGLIEPEERQSDGSTPDPENHASGSQKIVAFGLMRLLEKCYVRTSKVDVDGTEDNLFTVERGLPFNVDPGGAFNSRGNRSIAKVDIAQDAVAADPEADPPVLAIPAITQSAYVFSWEPRQFEEWSAYDAVEYLLTHHSPRRSDGALINRWEIEGDSTILDWYDIAMDCDEWQVKALIDGLINRTRGVGYWCYFDPSLTDPEDVETAENRIKLKLFTFAESAVTFPDTGTMPANPDQYSLDFEHALDIEEATVANMAMTRFHKITARGARRTTTFTARISTGFTWEPTDIIVPAWTESDEGDYKTAASAATDYSGLTTQEQQQRNAIYRTSARLQEVFTRFTLNPTKASATRWNGKIPVTHQAAYATGFEKWLVPDLSTDPFSPDVDTESTYDGRDHVPTLRIMRQLPLYERADYSGTNLETFDYAAEFDNGSHPSFVPVFAYARTTTGDAEPDDISVGQTPHRYEMLDRLSRGQEVSARDWNVRVVVSDTEPAIELVAPVPHFLSGVDDDMTDWAVTGDDQNPAFHGGSIDYGDIWVTLCVELNECIKASEELTTPAENAPSTELVLNVPKARCDYVIPYTTVEIKDGLPVQTTSGGFARDDREWLERVARSAAEWYGKDRQTLLLRYKQVRAMFSIGWLITDIGGRYNRTDIYTPITAITYTMPRGNQIGTTTLETSYATLDFTD